MNRPWLKSYPPGVPAEVDPREYKCIPEIFEKSVKKFATRPAYHSMGRDLSYAEVDQLTHAFAAYLLNELGLRRGDRVAIMMPNCLQNPIALFGTLRAGLIVVNVNPLYTARELEYQLKDSGAKAIVIVANFANTLEKVLKNTPVKHVILTELGDLLGFPKSAIVNFVVKRVKKMVPAFNIPGAIPFREVLSRGLKQTFQKPSLDHKDIAFLQYTGGTTGVAKGAILTHGNIVSNMIQARAWIQDLIREGEEIIVTALPLYHIFALTANCLVFASVGAHNVLITNPRDIPGFVKELSKWKFTMLTGVNTLFNALLLNPEFAKLDFKPLRLTLGGGMAVQRAVAERWKAVTGVPIIEAYGLTETSPAACINPLTMKEYNSYIGLPIPSTEVSIRDDNGQECPIGTAGELWIRGPQVTQGYWQKPEETKLVLTDDGWLKTGDVGVMTDDGYFKIVDRKKDMILVSGFNVYPNEIEDVVAKLPGIAEVAAVGVPDTKSGEVVKLFVVKKDNNLTEGQIMSYCKENLTSYKLPKHIEFRDSLPKTNVGKILRRELRDTPMRASG